MSTDSQLGCSESSGRALTALTDSASHDAYFASSKRVGTDSEVEATYIAPLVCWPLQHLRLQPKQQALDATSSVLDTSVLTKRFA